MEKMNNMPIVTAKDLSKNFEDIAKGTESEDLMVITDSLNPQYVLMSYERYLKVTNRLPENELIYAAQQGNGVWVTVIDVFAHAFMEYETTESRKRHLGKVRIDTDDKVIEILEIIDGVPQIYMYEYNQIQLQEENGKVLWIAGDFIGCVIKGEEEGFRVDEEYKNSTLKSAETNTWELEKQEKEFDEDNLPVIKIVYKKPR